MQDYAVTPGISEAMASQSWSSWIIIVLPIISRYPRNVVYQRIWKWPIWVFVHPLHSNSFLFACFWSSWITVKKLIYSKIDYLEYGFIAHETFVYAFFSSVLLTVNQDIVANLCVLQISKGVHEFCEALPCNKKRLEVLVWVFYRFWRGWGLIGKLFFAAIQKIFALAFTTLVHLHC